MLRVSRLRRLRQLSQSVCLALFVWLFWQTEYRGLDELPYPVSLLFRLDPLAALADLLAPGGFGWALLWPALLLVLLTILLGRFFCGWVCPLGATLDGCGSLMSASDHLVDYRWRRVKYLLLIGLLGAAFFGVQLLGLFDPLAIFLRTLTLAIYPAFNLILNALFDLTYAHPVPLVGDAVNRSYPFFRDHLMAFYQPYYQLGVFTLLVFVAILLLEKIERRFWCKNLCPLGALLGLCSGHALLRRIPAGACNDCKVCNGSCRMSAADESGQHSSECVLCLDCLDYCPHERVDFAFRRPSGRRPGVDLTRRGVVASLAAGALFAPVVRTTPAAVKLDSYLLRPPGAVAEMEFLQRCIRCGECMRVCIGGALHPALGQAGPVGLWTPLLIPRIGYCEYNCTLCGQVCPTGAIKRLPLEQKRQTVIGLAVFDKNRCLPFAKHEECLVCEEHCPTGEKAIVFEEQELMVNGEARRIKIPRVVDKLCIGCGICETKCPVEGTSAIRVINQGESRRKRDVTVADGYI